MAEGMTRHLEPCPKCQGQMVFKDSDEFEGAVNLRCTKCWLRYDCNENHRATAAKLWNASQPQVSAQPQVDEERAREALAFVVREDGDDRMADNVKRGVHPIIITSSQAIRAMMRFAQEAHSLASPEGVEP